MHSKRVQSFLFVPFFRYKAPHWTKNSIIKEVQSFTDAIGNYGDK